MHHKTHLQVCRQLFYELCVAPVVDCQPVQQQQLAALPGGLPSSSAVSQQHHQQAQTRLQSQPRVGVTQLRQDGSSSSRNCRRGV